MNNDFMFTDRTQLHTLKGFFFQQEGKLLEVDGPNVTIHLDPANFVQLTMAPIFPTVVDKSSRFNKNPNFGECKKIFGTNSYTKIHEMYMNGEVSREQYFQVLQSESFGMVTGSLDYDKNTYVCLDADKHQDRRTNKVVELTDVLLNSMRVNLFSKPHVFIMNESQSGNKHLYAVSSVLNHQSVKGLLFREPNYSTQKSKHKDKTFELDLKTSNNYVVIKGAGYSDILINGSLLMITNYAEEVISKELLERGIDLLSNPNYTNLESNEEKLTALIKLAVVFHVPFFTPQNLDSRVGTGLELELMSNRPKPVVETPTVKKAKTTTKKKVVAKAKTSKTFGVVKDHTPKKAQEEYDETEMPTKFTYDIATPRFRRHKLDRFTENYTVGMRGGSILSVASYLYLSNWSVDDAYELIVELDKQSSESLVRDGLTKEIESKVNSAFTGRYRPDRTVLAEVFGFDPYEKMGSKSKGKGKKGETYVPYRKPYSQLKQLHNNSLVSALLIGLKDALNETNEFTVGKSCTVKLQSIVDYVNLNVLNIPQARSYKSFSTIVRDVFVEFSQFDMFDVLALLNYKVEGDRFTQAEMPIKERLMPELASYDEIISYADVLKRAKHFNKIYENNKQLLGYLTMKQIKDLLNLNITLRRGRNGGMDVSVNQFISKSTLQIKELLSNERTSHKLALIKRVLKAKGIAYNKHDVKGGSFKRGENVINIQSHINIDKVKFYNGDFVDTETGEVVGDESNVIRIGNRFRVTKDKLTDIIQTTQESTS